MLQCNQLTCVREERILFENLSFSANNGQIIQIEGPNGVGKSTLFRTLIGLSRPYSGQVLWMQKDIHQHREPFYQKLLYLGHKSGVKSDLSALENLQFFQQMHQSHEHVNLYEILSKVGLAGYEDMLVSQLSAGQQRRVALARLWLNDCPLWVLDEPFTALDKSGIKVLENLFLEHAKQGGIILVTTHQDMSIDSSHFTKIKLQKSASEHYV
ncbi:heme exporter protein CcmA [Psychromonas sp. CNPT3]|uniref:cytochrome c biogenesis heme-transporting ATPase CcmA n=1 Tax=Psychromonas sp. CNPT3 TaxID=314282 RepID=UPI00006E78AD|nr:cytochrome c biogenesis heme-transporting ATPase CcmA [Psychromonas sp. CNPT3]AGH82030.1 heme exporter protein CcmA [Psychromonas sp. CNPT3]